MAYCLPRPNASKFLEALKDGTIDPGKLAAMTSEDRAAFFAKIVGDDNAHHVNSLFESKMLLKDQQRGMVTWAKNLAGIAEPVRRDLIAKIEKLDRVLNPDDERAFLADLAATKLGTKVTYEEAQKITELAQKATAERDKPTDNLSGVSNDYLNAAAALEHHINSLKPVSAVASIGKNAAIIARNHLLMNPSTPIKVTLGQALNSAIDIVSRRLAAVSLGGANPDLAAEANRQAWHTFRQTSFNTAMMESYEDSGRLGERANFDVPEGLLSANPALHAIEGGVRWYAKQTNHIAIDLEHNFTFTKFYQKAFFDMLNIASTNIAKGEGLTGDAMKTRAADIFADAARIKPTTDIGAIIRVEGQKQAARVTSTNDTRIANLALGVKNALNKFADGLGDALMPIAKIPANIIANGIENAGVGIPLGAKDIFQGRAKMQSEDMTTRYDGMAQFAFGVQKIARTVGVLGAAAFFSSLLTKRDFKEDNYGNSFVRIGGLWINMEYINAISPALSGMLMVKKDGRSSDTILSTASQYVSGTLQGLKHIPGVDELGHLVTSVTNTNYVLGVKKYAEGFVTSRGAPAFIQNLLKDRPIDRLFFGAHGVENQQDIRQDKIDQERQKLQLQREAHASPLAAFGAASP